MAHSFSGTISSGIVRLLEVVTGLSFLLLIISVTLQVVGRSAILDTPVWTEELTRFALLYLTAFGVGISYLKGDLVNVDIICEALPGKIPLVLRLVSAMIITILSGTLFYPAWKFVEIGKLQNSPALGVKMHFIHASVLLLLVFLFICALIRIFNVIQELTTKGELQ